MVEANTVLFEYIIGQKKILEYTITFYKGLSHLFFSKIKNIF